MPGFGSAVAWMIFAPLAFVTDAVGVVIILHYKPFFHSCDVAFMSLLVTMATNAWLLLPISAVMELGDVYWSKNLCTIYTWLSIMLRSSHLLVLLALNVYWVASLRMSTKGHMFMSSKCMKIFVIASWFTAVIIGLIPATGGTKIFPYYEENTCKFLPSDVSIGFAVFFIISSLLSAVMGFISTLDTLLIFQRMKDVALTKYNAGRFHIPTVSGVAQTNAQIHAKYNELNVSIELCRLVLFYSVASAVVNALPLMISQFIQLTQDHNRETMETTLLWLLLLEAFALPHFLWLLSRRYRHAIVYTWRVFILRDTSAREEDATACVLQAFRVHAKDAVPKPYRNGLKSLQANGTAHGPTIEDFTADLDDESSRDSAQGHSHSGMSGNNTGRDAGIMTTDLDDGLPALTSLNSPSVVTTHKKPQDLEVSSPSNETLTTTDATKLRGIMKNKATPKKAPRVSIGGSRLHDGYTASSTPTSPSKSSLDIPTPSAAEVKRSASASSRREWKERMRKKHLRAIFVNQSYDDADTDMDDSLDGKNVSGKMTLKDLAASTEIVSGIAKESNHRNLAECQRNASIESTYYMSSVYHHDYLSDSLPRGMKQQYTVESEGVSDTYDADDIETILDDSFTNEPTARESQGTGKSHGDQAPVTSLHNLVRSNQRSVIEQSVNRNTSVTLRRDGNQARDCPDIPPQPSSHSANILGVFYDDSPGDSQSSDQNDSLTPKEENFLRENDNVDDDYVSAPDVRPNIRRDNYRKFLSYTNLVISSVDDVNTENDEGSSFGIDAMNGEAGGDEEENDKPAISEDSNSLDSHKKTDPDDIGSSRQLADPLCFNNSNKIPISQVDALKMLSNEKKGKFPTLSEPAPQDYSQLETVSGSEMLHLKMKSLRPASAMRYSDDVVSEDGGVENKGFSEDSVDEEENEDVDKRTSEFVWGSGPEDGTTFSSTPRQSPMEMKKNQNSDMFRDSPDFDEIWSDRDGNGDGKEASPEIIHYSTRSPVQTSCEHTEDLQLHSNPPDSLQQSKLTDYMTNPFLRESFETLSQSPEYKNKFHSQENPFFSSTNSSTGSVFTSSVESIDDFLLETNSSRLVKDDKCISKHKETPSRAASSLNVSVETTDDTARSRIPPVPFMKPPRSRKHSQESKSTRHGSSEEELESILLEDQTAGKTVGDGSRINNGSVTLGKLRQEVKSSLPVALTRSQNLLEMAETESNESENSVVIEPYGQRRPPWLDEALTSPSENVDQYQVRESHDVDAFGNPTVSTDFRYSITSDEQDNVEQYDLDSVNIGGVSNLATKGSAYRSAGTSHPPLVQYHFDEDIDRGFEDALAVDYMIHSHVYSGMGLCFESIKEEPEESLSESASSFGVADNNSSNVFKTQAIVSRPSSRASGTESSTLETAPSPVEETQSVGFDNGVYFNQNDVISAKSSHPFPSFERTSADGSEEITSAYNGNGLGPPRKPTINDLWNSGDGPDATIAHGNILPGPAKSTKDNFNFETADDLQTRLASPPDSTDLLYDSPWLELGQVSPENNLDMSFESDFSHPNSDNTLQRNDFQVDLDDSENSNPDSCKLPASQQATGKDTTVGPGIRSSGNVTVDLQSVYF